MLLRSDFIMVSNCLEMKNILIILTITLLSFNGKTQTVKDLFQENTNQITWLGIDFSNIKLIGDFAQFSGAGEQSYTEIQEDYFPSWNKLILNEPVKFDIKGMLKKTDLVYNLDMLTKLNANSDISEIRAYNNPNYTNEDITAFIKKYELNDMSGIGVCFIAESFNKIIAEAYFHLVAINLETKEILLHEKLRGEPAGVGLRNYWVGSIYFVIKDIKKKKYKLWKSKYL